MIVGCPFFIRSIRYFCYPGLLVSELHALRAMERGKKVLKGENGSGSNRARRYDLTERSKVRILLCDNNAESCHEVFSLLCQYSYQGITILAHVLLLFLDLHEILSLLSTFLV